MTQETKNPELRAHAGNLVRSEVNKNADYDLEAWILDRIELRPGQSVLDLGCGNGKQVSRFAEVVGDRGRVVGADIFSKVEGLKAAAEASVRGRSNVEWLDHDASQPFDLQGGLFDAVTSCYSIYYFDNLETVLAEARRLLRRPGRFFAVGPAWDNSKEFYDLHVEISGKAIPDGFFAHLNRINDELVPLAYRMFPRVRISPFVNRVYFQGAAGVEAAASYYQNTLLLHETTDDEAEKRRLVDEFTRRVRLTVEREGVYHIVKRALGLVCFTDVTA
jgi:ubiquinone/menaquinone biosynthesis C-methylase UbiE